MKISFYIFFFTLAFHFANAQYYPDRAKVCTSYDGKEILWARTMGTMDIGISSLENLEMYPAQNSWILKTPYDQVTLSGNGKYIFWINRDSLFRGEIISGQVQNKKQIALGGFSETTLESTFDGSMVLASLAPHRTKKENCDPLYRALVLFKISGENYIAQDTFPKPKLCNHRVQEGHICDDGTLFWKYDYSKYLISIPTGNHYQTDTLFFLRRSYNGQFFVSRDAKNIFYCDWEKYPGGDSAITIYCRSISGNKASEPVLISEGISISNYSFEVGLSPNGKYVYWFQRTGRTTNKSLLPEGAYFCSSENGKWSSTEKIFGDGRTLNKYFALSDSGICIVGGQYGFSYLSFSDPSGRIHPLNVKFAREENPGEGRTVLTEIKIDSTLQEGEFVKVPFVFHNTDNDSVILQLNSFYSEPFTVDLRLPDTKNSYTTFKFGAMTAADEGQPAWMSNRYIVAPGDSIKIDVWVSFTSSNETQFVYFQKNHYPAKDLSSAYSVIIKSGKVIPKKIRNDFGINYYPNGKPMEEISHDSKGDFFYKAWYRNGNLKMNISFDEKYNFTGTWKLYSENGKLIYMRDHGRKKGNYSTKAWYENGNEKWKQKVKRNCPVRTEKTWYEDGALKSKTKWKRSLVVNICSFRPVLQFTTVSTASTYKAYYNNGQKKLKVHFSRYGNLRGKSRSWHENGQLRGSEYHDFLRGRLKRHTRIYSSDGKLIYDYDNKRKKQLILGTYRYNSGLGEYPKCEYRSGEIDHPSWGGGKF